MTYSPTDRLITFTDMYVIVLIVLIIHIRLRVNNYVDFEYTGKYIDTR